MKIATIVGARPQFIKAAAVCRAMAGRPDVTHLLIHTGQHYDEMMSDVFFEELEIQKPDRHLGVGSGSHAAQTGQMLQGVESALIEVKPDLVLVYGDTNSTLAGALAAVKLHLPVAHVESGLRSFNRRMPEEINRVLTDHMSEILFAPTSKAVENLRKEGIAERRIHQIGDVMYDSALFYGRKAEAGSRVLADLGLRRGGYLLATVHRAENTDDAARLEAIVEGLGRVSASIPVLFPVHPRTKAALTKAGLLDRVPKGIRVIPPVGYLDMVVLEKNAALIATDSGGVQKEALFYRVPCITLRDETEWVETVEVGANQLVGADAARLEAAVKGLLKRGTPPPDPGALYGDGQASARIVQKIAPRVS